MTLDQDAQPRVVSSSHVERTQWPPWRTHECSILHCSAWGIGILSFQVVIRSVAAGRLDVRGRFAVWLRNQVGLERRRRQCSFCRTEQRGAAVRNRMTEPAPAPDDVADGGGSPGLPRPPLQPGQQQQRTQQFPETDRHWTQGQARSLSMSPRERQFWIGTTQRIRCQSENRELLLSAQRPKNLLPVARAGCSIGVSGFTGTHRPSA